MHLWFGGRLLKFYKNQHSCPKFLSTLFESENERQKIEPVPIPLPRASRNFPDVKTRNDFFFHNWTSEIIPFIRFGMQMDRTNDITRDEQESSTQPTWTNIASAVALFYLFVFTVQYSLTSRGVKLFSKPIFANDKE